MAMRVRLAGDLHKLTGSNIIEIEGNDQGGLTLGQAVQELVRRYPRLGEQLFDEQGRIRYTWLLVSDGQTLDWRRDRDRILAEGGELLIMRFFSGG